jgi:hypothetical protein
VTDEPRRIEDVELLERERAALSLLHHGTMTDPDDRWMLLGLVVRPGEFATTEGEQ